MTGDKSARYAEAGLKEHGPFDREHFTPKTPHLVVVTPSRYQGAVEQFVRSFRDGVPNSTFADGFVRRFGLSGLHVSLVTFDGTESDAGAYRSACKRALEEHPKTNMAIVIVSKKQQHLAGNASPYLIAKSMFMSQSVPVQEFQIENLRDRDFTEILRNVSLACYAKLGGIPYLIRSPYRVMAHELVIGLGSAYRTTERMAAAERSVGITTVFDALGNYVVSNTSREADYDHYPAALREALVECIEDVKRRNSWQPQDTVRLVFHAFKPLPDREAVAVKRLVEGIAKDFVSVDLRSCTSATRTTGCCWTRPTRAREMLAAALRAEVAAYVEGCAGQVDEQGRRLVVRNGYHAAREVLTSAGRSRWSRRG
jgi:Piwi domain